MDRLPNWLKWLIVAAAFVVLAVISVANMAKLEG